MFIIPFIFIIVSFIYNIGWPYYLFSSVYLMWSCGWFRRVKLLKVVVFIPREGCWGFKIKLIRKWWEMRNARNCCSIPFDANAKKKCQRYLFYLRSRYFSTLDFVSARFIYIYFFALLLSSLKKALDWLVIFQSRLFGFSWVALGLLGFMLKEKILLLKSFGLHPR